MTLEFVQHYSWHIKWGEQLARCLVISLTRFPLQQQSQKIRFEGKGIDTESKHALTQRQRNAAKELPSGKRMWDNI